ncbi:AGE family epimerase/isomerase, partial [Planctomycetota bacterium]
ARATLQEAFQLDGGLLYEAGPEGARDTDRHWWPQAEAVVGFLNTYQLTEEQPFLEAALKCWAYIQQHIIDSQRGEWYWKVSREGIPDMEEPKVSQWKGPYHNSRMCFEVLARLEIIAASDL